MKIDEIWKLREELIEKMNASSAELVAYCEPYRGEMGLISDECSNSEEYKRLSNEFEINKHYLGIFNKMHSKNKELKKAIRDNVQKRLEAQAKKS